MVITISSSSYNSSNSSSTETDEDLKSNHQSTIRSTTHHRKIYAFASRRPPSSRCIYNNNDLIAENRLILNNLQKLVTEGDMNNNNNNIGNPIFSCPSNVRDLRSQIMRNDDSMQIENDFQMDLEAVPHASRSSSSTIQRMDIERSVPHGSLFIREPKYPVEKNSLKQKAIVVYKDTATHHNELKNNPTNGKGSTSLPGSSKKEKKNEKGLEGLGVININDQDINLKFLACFADDAFNATINKMTEDMETKDELLNFLNGLSGRWSSNRKRRKYVKASMLLKALPVRWEVLLSFKPRAHQPYLYCRKFVSPHGVEFSSCRDVALDLISKYATRAANRPSERAIMQVENERQVIHKGVTQVPESSPPTTKPDLLGSINLKARCTLCLAVFFPQHLDTENSASSTSFVCPCCKEELNSQVKSSLALYNQHANK